MAGRDGRLDLERAGPAQAQRGMSYGKAIAEPARPLNTRETVL